ncbi:DNA mismatch repair protein MutS2 [Marinitoga hydrogenitolerans DSM 16785]|uniref:Endonuclease MutS2 n=1 Tax=Marinitoga hydrogenitolerans (strain DSM 16785 / JCM 12826 / AT1271) TaxID=1122195 RepID=A0A1M4XR75_MARH1|nr:Smr/MutS family protein [Marinitoga hydrogenitolerans]SHE95958.1 DNA mismatch repair protein MutS2 [Marinitoga hydrogenitolerans DSM 16785]
MNQKTYKDLEIKKILENISKFAISEYGKNYIVNNFKYIKDYDLLKTEYEILEEFINFTTKNGEFDLRGIPSIYTEIDKLKNNIYLSSIEYKKISDFLSQSINILEENKKLLNGYNKLEKIIYSIPNTSNLVKLIEKSIDQDGNIKDTASDNLRKLRKKIENTKKNLYSSLKKIISKYHKYISLEQPTLKNNRYCIVIRSEHKNKIDGNIIAYSDTGVSVYIEPYEIGKLNSELSDLIASEKAEITRILGQIFLETTKNLYNITKTINTIEYIDGLNAKFRYSKKMGYVFSLPDKNNHIIYLDGIRHPLIEKEKVIPVNLKLPENKLGMIITGPNTGGKTVVLKSVGLSIVLSHALLPIPVYSAKIPFFKNVFTDIGDEQSIEQTLSTFSAHLNNVKYILDNANENSLVLIDELGTGTDPIEGSALALAIIEKLIELKSTFFITSHLSAVKIFSIENTNLLSASMGFDKETLSPTYKLLVGVPGASHAIDIAEKLGLPEDVLLKASNFLSKEQVFDEKILENLTQIYEELEKEKEAHKTKHKEVVILKQDLEKKLELLRKKEIEKIDNEIKKYKDYLRKLKKDIDLYINTLKKEKDLNKIRDLSKKIENKKSELNELKINIKNTPKKDIKIGDIVNISGEKAKIVNIKGEKILVKFINKPFELSVSINDIKFEKERLKNSITSINQIPIIKNVKNEIDIRGMTVEEALPDVEKFISDLSASNSNGGYIIHGKGTGKLALGIWNFLRNNKRVKSFRLGNDKEGGTGVTFIEVK